MNFYVTGLRWHSVLVIFVEVNQQIDWARVRRSTPRMKTSTILTWVEIDLRRLTTHPSAPLVPSYPGGPEVTVFRGRDPTKVSLDYHEVPSENTEV